MKGAEALDPGPLDDVVGNLAFERSAPAGETQLIAVTLDNPDGQETLPLVRDLRAAGLSIALDDHRNLSGPMERALASGGGAIFALEGLLLIGMAAAVYISAAGQARRGWERFDLMRRLGARKGFVSRLIASRCSRVVLWAAVVGVAIPMAIAATRKRPATSCGPRS